MEGILHWAAVLGLAALMANVFLAGLVVFFERRNPASTWAWLLVLFFIPILGFLIYMIFGRNGRREKMFREKAKYDQEVYYKYLFRNVRSVEKIQTQKSIVENHGRLRGAEYLTDLAHLHLNSGNWMTFNNRVQYFSNGKKNFMRWCRISAKQKSLSIWNTISGAGTSLARVLWRSLQKKRRKA